MRELHYFDLQKSYNHQPESQRIHHRLVQPVVDLLKKMVQLDQNRFRPVSMVRSESDTFSSLLSECGQAPFGAAVQKIGG
jgi:hypothetical protein